MSKTLPLFIAAWLVTLAAAFFTGRTTAEPETVVETVVKQVPVASSASMPAYAPAPAPSDLSDDPTALTVRSEPPDDFPTVIEYRYIEKEVREISVNNVQRTLEDNDPVARMTAFTEMLKGITPENAQSMMEAFDNLAVYRPWERNLAMYAWSIVDGQAATDYTFENTPIDWGVELALDNVLTGWATVDADAAEDWARAKTAQDDKPYLIGVIRGIARNDLAKATDLTYSLPDGVNRRRALDALINGYFEKGSSSAINWVKNLYDEDESLKRDITNKVVSKLARSDLAKAGALAATIEDPIQRSQVMSRVVSEWAYKDPVKAVEYLNQFGQGPEMDAPIEKVAWQLFEDNPEAALVWAGQIYDKGRRFKALELISRRWLERDPEGASRLLNPQE